MPDLNLAVEGGQEVGNDYEANDASEGNGNPEDFALHFGHDPELSLIFLWHFFEEVEDDAKIVADEEASSSGDGENVFL